MQVSLNKGKTWKGIIYGKLEAAVERPGMQHARKRTRPRQELIQCILQTNQNMYESTPRYFAKVL